MLWLRTEAPAAPGRLELMDSSMDKIGQDRGCRLFFDNLLYVKPAEQMTRDMKIEPYAAETEHGGVFVLDGRR
jgi:hypothetical protein